MKCGYSGFINYWSGILYVKPFEMDMIVDRVKSAKGINGKKIPENKKNNCST